MALQQGGGWENPFGGFEDVEMMVMSRNVSVGIGDTIEAELGLAGIKDGVRLDVTLTMFVDGKILNAIPGETKYTLKEVGELIKKGAKYSFSTERPQLFNFDSPEGYRSLVGFMDKKVKESFQSRLKIEYARMPGKATALSGAAIGVAELNKKKIKRGTGKRRIRIV